MTQRIAATLQPPMLDEMQKLTIGLPCYDDFDGMWFSVMALRMFHAECMEEVEIVVVDNNPRSPSGQATREAIQQMGDGVRYVPFQDSTGPANAKEHVFHQARTEYVLCMDSHVLIERGAIRKLIDFFDAHPDANGLYHGPLWRENLRPDSISTHLRDEWRGGMRGIWETDPRGIPSASEHENHQGELEPFEIPAQGMGLFTCRKRDWLGFNPEFRGYGGEEYYIHDKYRSVGRSIVCLPFLKWVHRFGRPNGISYPLAIRDRLRNYLVGAVELGQEIESVTRNYDELLSKPAQDAVVIELAARGLIPENVIQVSKDDSQSAPIVKIAQEPLPTGRLAEGRSRVFSKIFQENTWGNAETKSGPGSTVEATRHVASQLSVLLPQLGTKVLLDIPCGEYHWIRTLDLRGAAYIGADVSPDVVAHNQRYANDKTQFLTLDIVESPLPSVDVVLVRDCLVHLPIRDCMEAMFNICRSRSKFLLMTTFPYHMRNDDIAIGEWRALNFELRPFHLPAPITLIHESPEPGDSCYQKCLGIWSIDQVRQRLRHPSFWATRVKRLFS